MSNNLISRSETERLLRAYADEVGCNRGDYELANGILKAVCFLSDSENVPTGYDVGKVVKRLENVSIPEDKVLYASPDEFGQFVKLKDAIKIVKSGGIE